MQMERAATMSDLLKLSDEELMQHERVRLAYWGLVEKDDSWSSAPNIPVSIYQAAFEMRDALDYVTWFSKLIEVSRDDPETDEVTAETLGETPSRWIVAAVMCYEGSDDDLSYW